MSNILPAKQSSKAHLYRYSIDFPRSELFRQSVSKYHLKGNFNTQNQNIKSKFRNSLNFEDLNRITRVVDQNYIKKQKSGLKNLKTRLDELQAKIKKGKGQICLTPKTKQHQVDAFLDIIEALNEKTPSRPKLIDDFKFNKAKEISKDQKKDYYIGQVVSIISGNNQRASEHLQLALNVCKNHFRAITPTLANIEQKKVYLPRSELDKGKKTLIVDIDQTLIHCTEDPTQPYDIILPIQVETGNYASAYISIRPYAVSFLKRMAKLFQIIAFTASHESYADVILNELDPNREYIRHRLYRKNCMEIHQNLFSKDLRIINRNLDSMVLIDNAPYSYMFQIENGIPILPFYNGQDNELAVLEKYLSKLSKCDDVRQMNRKHFGLNRYMQFGNIDELIRQLYLNSN